MQSKTRRKTVLQLFSTAAQQRTPIVGKTVGSLMATACLSVALLSSGTALGQEVIVGLAIDAEGKVGIGTDAPTSTLDVAGDVQTSGDITSSGEITSETGYIRDDLDVGGSLDVGGVLDAGGDLNVNGDLDVSGALLFDRYYKNYSVSAEDSSGQHNKHEDMGSWDLCFLTRVKFAGVDNHSGDQAKCEISVSPRGSRTVGPEWTLSAKAEDDVNLASCKATCMSFTGQCTGEDC